MSDTTTPYDFSSLHEPMSRGEARDRRRTLRGGRSYFDFLEIEHWAGLIVFGGISLFLLLPMAVVASIAVFSSITLVESAAEAVGAAGVGVLLPLAIVAIIVGGIRLLVIPPRWRAWVRMARFAERNALEFVIEERIAQPPGTLFATHAPIQRRRLYGAFRDVPRGITLGDFVIPAATAFGIGSWYGVIVIETGRDLADDRLGYASLRELLGEVAGPWNIEVEVVDGTIVAVKTLPFRTRRFASLERAFAIATKLHQWIPSLASNP